MGGRRFRLDSDECECLYECGACALVSCDHGASHSLQRRGLRDATGPRSEDFVIV
jgi:hypothetical protein